MVERSRRAGRTRETSRAAGLLAEADDDALEGIVDVDQAGAGALAVEMRLKFVECANDAGEFFAGGKFQVVDAERWRGEAAGDTCAHFAVGEELGDEGGFVAEFHGAS
jgi:hypothetical protein